LFPPVRNPALAAPLRRSVPMQLHLLTQPLRDALGTREKFAMARAPSPAREGACAPQMSSCACAQQLLAAPHSLTSLLRHHVPPRVSERGCVVFVERGVTIEGCRAMKGAIASRLQVGGQRVGESVRRRARFNPSPLAPRQ